MALNAELACCSPVSMSWASVSQSPRNEIPLAACLRVQPGVAEAAELFNHMVVVSAFPQFAKDLGNEARRHIREHHSLELAARRYWEILCTAGSC